MSAPPRWMPVPGTEELQDPRLFLNRDLSLLDFNRRVLAQAIDPEVPLLERLRFLAISSSNLDEFFEVRAASHRERVAHGATARTFDGRTSNQVLAEIAEASQALVREQYRVFNEVLVPALNEEGIHLLRRREWDRTERAWVREHFRSQILPVLTPMGLDNAHPFPRILNKSLNFVVLVDGQDAYGRDAEVAIVRVPRSLPRVMSLPVSRHAPGAHVMLSSIIHAHVAELFPGMQVRGCYQFRVTRNGDLWVDEEEVENLLQALRGELPERQFADAVRLEVADDCPDSVAEFLLDRFDLGPADLYRVDGPVNLNRLGTLWDVVDRPDLKYPAFIPRVPRQLANASSPFEAIRSTDVVLHHPYESFQPLVDLVKAAATDPDVLAIKSTLYRTGADSPLVEALLEAARNGKQVTTVVELRARFDEERNIGMAERLQEVGANVVYGIVGYKTHAKLLMIVRREGEQLRRYCHLGTGNYHAGTARTYTDIGLLTAREDFGQDVHRVFQQLTGLGAELPLTCLLQSPFTLMPTLLGMIENEAERARRGEPARIVAKMNALTEPNVIRALYLASRAGVQVDLIVRGACCLRPGVPGVSENIRVRSILGRFLEHHRLYWFRAGGEGRLFASSADWMSRNLHRRVEVCFPIDEPRMAERVLNEGLLIFLEDDVRAWDLDAEGRWTMARPKDGQPLRDVHTELLQSICGKGLAPSGELEPDPDAAQGEGLGGQVRLRERVLGEPPVRKRQA